MLTESCMYSALKITDKADDSLHVETDNRSPHNLHTSR